MYFFVLFFVQLLNLSFEIHKQIDPTMICKRQGSSLWNDIYKNAVCNQVSRKLNLIEIVFIKFSINSPQSELELWELQIQEKCYPAPNCQSKAHSNQHNKEESLCNLVHLNCRQIRDKLKEDVSAWKAKLPGFSPGLAIVQVGGREDSNVYIRMKIKAANEIGIEVNHLKLPRTTTQQELMSKVYSTNPSTFFTFVFCCETPIQI